MKKLSLVLLLVLAGVTAAMAQRTISGTVTDVEGEALIGASILAQGTSTGTVQSALRGRAAGVVVQQTSGAPGSGFNVRVRGATSINASNAPLYVVDGMFYDDINWLNSNDIESFF